MRDARPRGSRGVRPRPAARRCLRSDRLDGPARRRHPQGFFRSPPSTGASAQTPPDDLRRRAHGRRCRSSRSLDDVRRLLDQPDDRTPLGLRGFSRDGSQTPVRHRPPQSRSWWVSQVRTCTSTRSSDVRGKGETRSGGSARARGSALGSEDQTSARRTLLKGRASTETVRQTHEGGSLSRVAYGRS